MYFNIGYPKAGKLSVASGKIKRILNEYEFYYNNATEKGPQVHLNIIRFFNCYWHT